MKLRLYELLSVVMVTGFFIWMMVYITSCRDSGPQTEYISELDSLPLKFDFTEIKQDVYMGDYLDFMDTLSISLSEFYGYLIDEYALVHRNPWLLDSLMATDYYRLMAQERFIEDPRSIKILSMNDTLRIPGPSFIDSLEAQFEATMIDVNIPEFTLRIKVREATLHAFPVRVGQNTQKYLAMAGKTIDLRTKSGSGFISRISRNPDYINPKNNHIYTSTRRDDGKVTGLPRIPWLEPEIGGQLHGQLIHPTTNPITLGKASSNGCIGVREADMWMIYYHAPLGTKVNIRYQLEVQDQEGNVKILRDIYPGRDHRNIAMKGMNQDEYCICNL